jgi:predicted amidohydrolase
MPIDSKLNIAILSLNISWGDREENLFSVKQAVHKISDDTDVVVLPELFTTGFLTETEMVHNLAENPADSPTIDAIKHLAAKKNAAFVGSFLAKVNDEIFNRAFFIEPSGECTYYDKHHLFSPGEESRYLATGAKQCQVVRFRGWNIQMAICYDVRFPVWCRNEGLKYDALIIPANWPEKRAHAWKSLLCARAIENQAYVIGANRSGQDDYGVYNNQSYIFDHMGKDISEKVSDEIILATLLKEPLKKYRESFPVWKDADSFSISH